MSGAAKFGIGVLIAAGILLMLALIVLIAYFWMDSHGKARLPRSRKRFLNRCSRLRLRRMCRAMMRMRRWRQEVSRL